ncbi:putative copper resistance protein D [Flavimobilis soli]|uniref:Putative copper resistance protein D n=1 Tax=Flavimobilis soli TaxID=442709 RepID=A0A2A9EE08_9MICO|nr:bifunctional copper resistance protein CopD/cytochrome c oxidase assembly protein [Flavimobilis soli]PFG37043.1 putative copper resistance protein D [Flavimobilis soli]
MQQTPTPTPAVPAIRRRHYALSIGTAVATGLLLVLLAGTTTQIFAPAVIADPGALVRWTLPLVSVAGELATAITIGALVAVVFLLGDNPDRSRALLVAATGASLWTLTAVADTLLTFTDVLGGQPSDGAYGAQLASFLTDVPLGRILLAITIIAAAVALLAILVRTPTGAAWTLALAASALALRSLTGHSAGASGHNIAVSAMFLHLVGAATWVGVLLALAALRTAGGLRGPAMADAVARFSPVAAWCLAIVGYSGIASATVRLDGPSDLTTGYGRLVIAKVVLIAAIGVLGLMHRRALVARSAGGRLAHEGRTFWRLVTVELVLMGAVVGVASALGASSPPVPDEAGVGLTPAEIVTGEPLPPEQTAATWFTQWRWDVLMTLLIAAAIVVYIRWVLRLRRRGDHWSWGRTAAWCTGMLVMLWVTSGGAAVYGHVLFSAHMVQHMVMAMVVPLFLTMSAPVTLALRALPKRHDGSRGPREWLLVLVQSRWGSFFASPLVAATNFAGSMILFYFTDLFEWSLTTHVGHIAMIVHFTLAGYLFANALIGIDPGPKRPGYPMRLLLLFATMAFHAFFGVTLVTSEVLLVPEWFGLLGRTWGKSAIADQQVGGSVAWGIGEIPTMVLAVVVAVRWAKDDERAARRRDRRVAARGDAELDDYNEMLAKLAERDG